MSPVPPPEWDRNVKFPPSVYNKLWVYGKPKNVERFVKRAIGRSPWTKTDGTGEPDNELNFHSLVPIPAKVLKAGYDREGRDWEIKHWGVQWGACNPGVVEDSDEFISYEFDTLAKPPIAFLKQVSKNWPGLGFVFRYAFNYHDYTRYRNGVGKTKVGKLKHRQLEHHEVNRKGKEAANA